MMPLLHKYGGGGGEGGRWTGQQTRGLDYPAAVSSTWEGGWVGGEGIFRSCSKNIYPIAQTKAARSDPILLQKKYPRCCANEICALSCPSRETTRIRPVPATYMQSTLLVLVLLLSYTSMWGGGTDRTTLPLATNKMTKTCTHYACTGLHACTRRRPCLTSCTPAGKSSVPASTCRRHTPG